MMAVSMIVTQFLIPFLSLHPPLFLPSLQKWLKKGTYGYKLDFTILRLPFHWLKDTFHFEFNECQKAKQAFTQTLLPARLAGLCPVELHTLAMLTLNPISHTPHAFVQFPFLSVLQHQAPLPRQITVFFFKILLSPQSLSQFQLGVSFRCVPMALCLCP